jgi:hypothetical protein
VVEVNPLPEKVVLQLRMRLQAGGVADDLLGVVGIGFEELLDVAALGRGDLVGRYGRIGAGRKSAPEPCDMARAALVVLHELKGRLGFEDGEIECLNIGQEPPSRGISCVDVIFVLQYLSQSLMSTFFNSGALAR